MILQRSTDVAVELFYDKYGDISPIDVLYEKQIINPNGLIQLQNIPSLPHTVFTVKGKEGVAVTTYNKVETITNKYDFTVDYLNGVLTFHSSQVGREILVSYTNSIGRLCISADRIFANIDNQSNVVETLGTLLEEGRQTLSDLEVLGGATKVITEIEGYIESIRELTGNIIQGNDINSKLKESTDTAKTTNSTLNSTIKNADNQIGEMNKWVESHGDIVNLDNRVDTTENKLNTVNTQLAETNKEKATKLEVDIERKRINEFVALPEGSIQGNAELADLRISANGFKYELGGDSLRNQFSILNNLTNIRNVTPSIVNDFYVTPSGNKAPNTSFYYVEPILLKKDETIYFRAKGYLTNMLILSECTKEGDFKSSLIASKDGNIKDFSYKAPKEMYVMISSSKGYILTNVLIYKNVDSRTNLLLKYLELINTVEIIKLDLVLDNYVTASGNVAKQNKFVHTKPILINKGETISIYGRGYNGGVAMISSCDSTGNNIKVLVADNRQVDEKIYSYKANEEMYVILSGNETNFLAFKKREEGKTPIKNEYNYLAMFKKIGGIGDSLMSGEHAYYQGSEQVYIDRYDFSWLTYLTNNSKSEKVHYSKGGLTAKSWYESEYKTNLQNEEKKCNAYYIGLCTNDYYTNPYPLGSINDVNGTNSFVGYYKRIIEFVHSVAPNSKIFLVSGYSISDESKTYSDAIKEISKLYDYCFYIDLINKSDVLLARDMDYVSLGHFNTLGYIKLSKNIENITNEIIVENLLKFAMFGLND